MTDHELSLRALYLYFSCSRHLEQALGTLLAALPASGRAEAGIQERAARREFGLLFRHWAAHEIWERMDEDAQATKLNLELLRLFTSGFKLSKDGSGLRYAELSSLEEELKEFWHRLARGLGVEDTRLLSLMERSAGEWRSAVTEAVEQCLQREFSLIEAEVKEWTQATPRPEGLIPPDAPTG
jgi:hypothetical protein